MYRSILDNGLEWTECAKCKSMPPDNFDLAPERISAQRKADKAKKLCAGCPVKSECATDALRYDAWGTVRAGVWLPDYGFMNPHRRRYIDELRCVAMGQD
ncbi:WhiB family transcriptional regulator [Corynebacterium striatum]